MYKQNLPGLVLQDIELLPFAEVIYERLARYKGTIHLLEQAYGSLMNFANAHKYLGFNYDEELKGWWYREWAPNARALYLTGDFNGWSRSLHPLKPNNQFIWEIFLDDATYKNTFTHGSLLKVIVQNRMGEFDRIPAYIKRAVQDPVTKDFTAQHWAPAKPFKWKHKTPKPSQLMIYEAHIGMAQEYEGVGSFKEFTENVLPRIANAGYNAIQLMAIQEHPYYGSFGYHVANFYAVSSRFGAPEELKELIDTAHGLGLVVIMDLVHSHSVKNFNEGLVEFDGTDYQYFLPGSAGYHTVWDSMLFNYGKWEVMQFLLSNVRFWLEEFNFDGFRFDGVTSMLYHHHGLDYTFTSLNDYFTREVNADALLYLQLANLIAHKVKPGAITIAEDVSGMPGLGRPQEEGGVGFDYRLGMSIPDFWIKQLQIPDEQWNVGDMWGSMLNRRKNEKTIAYSESHDQAMVGDQTLTFRLMGPEMYHKMGLQEQSLVVDRGVALSKLIKLITTTTAGEAYLNFMGNEFGHPDWIDFPRTGNDWSYRYARRLWSLVDNEHLKYHHLGLFDKDLMDLVAKYQLLNAKDLELIFEDKAKQLIAWRKGDLIVAININPVDSFFGVVFNTGLSACYHIILSSDDKKYAGHQRVDTGIGYFSDNDGFISLYLPNRCGIVLKADELSITKPIEATQI